MSEMTFPYRRKPALTAFVVVILICVAAVPLLLSLQPEVPEMDFALFVLEAATARAAFMTLGVVFIVTAGFLIYSVFWVQRGERGVVLGASELQAYKTVSSGQSVTVPYSEILSIQRVPVYRSWRLIVRYTGGTIHIPEPYMANWDSFLALEKELGRRVKVSRS